jgi:hypothetical protein
MQVRHSCEEDCMLGLTLNVLGRHDFGAVETSEGLGIIGFNVTHTNNNNNNNNNCL